LFLSASPIEFCTASREHDGRAITDNIDAAQVSVSVSVMDYYPLAIFANPEFWYPLIDNAIRKAAFRGVRVRLLFSWWHYSPPLQLQYWRSLAALDNVEVRVFVVPPQSGTPVIPYTRVNHAKLLVTESVFYVGTSNWAGDYFVSTGGVGWTIASASVVAQAQAIFDRDYNSNYTEPCTLAKCVT